MGFLPLVFLVAGLWNLFLVLRSFRRGYATAWFQRCPRDSQPAAFWAINTLAGLAGLMLIGSSFLIRTF
jgi:hypothetical protein